MNKGRGKRDNFHVFPRDYYNPRLAGKDVKFSVKLIDLKEKILPELNDDFAKDLGQELETVEALTDRVRQELTDAANDRVVGQMRQQIRDKLLEMTEVEAPESLVSQELEAMVQNTKFNIKRSGLSLEAVGMSEAMLRDEYHEEAVRRVKASLDPGRHFGKGSL